jgi:hypothetical protein
MKNALPMTLSIGTKPTPGCSVGFTPSPYLESREFARLSPITKSMSSGTSTASKSLVRSSR